MLLPADVASYSSTPACIYLIKQLVQCMPCIFPPLAYANDRSCERKQIWPFTRMYCAVFVERVMCYDCHPEGCLVNSLPVTHSSPCVSTRKEYECRYVKRASVYCMYVLYIVHLHESVVFSCLTEKTCWNLLLSYDFVLACGGTWWHFIWCRFHCLIIWCSLKCEVQWCFSFT